MTRARVHSRPTTWTPAADAKIRQMRGDGASLREIARHFGIADNAVSARVRALGLPIKQHVKPASPRPDYDTREPLPAGHPISWDLVTRGTSMAGCRYPDLPQIATQMLQGGDAAARAVNGYPATHTGLHGPQNGF